MCPFVTFQNIEFIQVLFLSVRDYIDLNMIICRVNCEMGISNVFSFSALFFLAFELILISSLLMCCYWSNKCSVLTVVTVLVQIKNKDKYHDIDF